MSEIVEFPRSRTVPKQPSRVCWMLFVLSHCPQEERHLLLNRAQHVLRMIDKDDANLVRALLEAYGGDK